MRRRRRASTRFVWRRSLLSVALIATLAALFGLAFAGSPTKLAAGVEIAGEDVGGLTPRQARARLERHAARLDAVPVTFTAGSRTWRVRPSQLGLEVDWASAIASARREGEGLGPVRGFRRLRVRFFGGEVVPAVRVWDSALTRKLDTIERAVNRRHRDAALELRGLRVVVLRGVNGRLLDRPAAARTIVHALASPSREPVALPVRVDPRRVTAARVAPAAAAARRALAAPVRLALGRTRWRVPRWRTAGLLDLPEQGATKLRIGGPGADRFFARLRRTVERAPREADFAVASSGVQILPDRDGLALDAPATARALLAAATARAATRRLARVVVRTQPAKRTTAGARAMGITDLVGGYETEYGGDPNRIHNVQLVSRLLDGTLIAPGAEFSFNGKTGERTAAKGFLEAPVIINGELQTGLGGGVCQVSTTVFNAAYEAGLDITARTNHALYISHYPLGRDATVNYPDLDLRFVNDTAHWLLLRTFVGSSSLVVNLYGTPTHRRVESEAAPLTATGPPPLERISDPELLVGRTALEASGSPPLATNVRRLVYDGRDKLLHDDTWYSSYRGEPRVVRVGTKPKPKPKPKPATTSAPETTTTETAPGETPSGESTTTPPGAPATTTTAATSSSPSVTTPAPPAPETPPTGPPPPP